MKRYKFTVTGAMPFPLDMLRYDSCWPRNSEDVCVMYESIKSVDTTPATIKLSGANPPTKGRWRSFMWNVEMD